MSVQRLPDDDAARDEHGRDDVLRLVRQRLSQAARVVRLRSRTRGAAGVSEPVTPSPNGPDELRD